MPCPRKRLSTNSWPRNSASSSVTLGVVKINPALRLYERLGFRITHDDARKFYMRRDLRMPS
jgi:hypothetical protein